MRRYLLGAFLAINIFVWAAALSAGGAGILTVAFLDVGQGDAVFIEAPNGNQILIDAGSNRKVLSELGSVLPVFDKTIDAILITHPDKDHIGGVPEMLRRYDVARIFVSGVSCDTAICLEFEKLVDEEGAEVVVARRGMVIDLGSGAYLSILFPDRDVSGIDPNDGSIIAKLSYGATSFMLTGDAPKKIEEYLVSRDGENLDSDILKAGHHGSKTSSASAFVALVSPEYAIVSAGKDNSYGHPHKEVLDTFEQFDVDVLGTYESGRIIFQSDGEKIWIK